MNALKQKGKATVNARDLRRAARYTGGCSDAKKYLDSLPDDLDGREVVMMVPLYNSSWITWFMYKSPLYRDLREMTHVYDDLIGSTLMVQNTDDDLMTKIDEAIWYVYLHCFVRDFYDELVKGVEYYAPSALLDFIEGLPSNCWVDEFHDNDGYLSRLHIKSDSAHWVMSQHGESTRVEKVDGDTETVIIEVNSDLYKAFDYIEWCLYER